MSFPRHSDSWLKECGEATHLADDISLLLNERLSMPLSGLDPSRLVFTTRHKLTMLVTKLDRLESLLRNPPVNVNLSDKEFHRREDLLLLIRKRTKEMAGSLRVPQASKRADLVAEEAEPSTILQQSNSIVGYDIGRPLTVHEYATSATGACTKENSASLVDEEMNLQKPLVASEEASDSSTVQQIAHMFTYLYTRAEEKCSPLYICLVMICIVVFIVLLVNMLKVT